jgi:hypothetical protein
MFVRIHAAQRASRLTYTQPIKAQQEQKDNIWPFPTL